MSTKINLDGFERRGFLRALAGGAAGVSIGAGASMFAMRRRRRAITVPSCVCFYSGAMTE
jgi:hypothetical protein